MSTVSPHRRGDSHRKAMPMTPLRLSRFFNSTIIICSLGYFVDIYDLILFSIVRIPSLKAIGISETDLMERGTALLNYHRDLDYLELEKNSERS